MNKATTFFNKLNAHPDKIEAYGTGIVSLASFFNAECVQVIAKNHLIIKNNTNPPHLLWSNIPYQLNIGHDKHGNTEVNGDLPIKPGEKLVLNSPRLVEIQRCFYQILAVILQKGWEDKSIFTPQQLKFLLRLSGMKITNSQNIIKAWDVIKNSLEPGQTGKSVQKACLSMIGIIQISNQPKLIDLLTVVQLEHFNNNAHYIPQIAPRKGYFNNVKNVKDRKIRKSVKKLKKSNDIFIAVNQEKVGMILNGQDLIELINALIYYLK